MRLILLLLVYLAVVFVGGALLAPWVYWTACFLGPAVGWNAAAQPFHRYVHRCLLALAVCGLWWLAKAGGLRDWRSIGFRREGGWWQRWTRGFLLGWGMLGALVLVQWAAGAALLKPGFAESWPSAVGRGAGAALLVSVLEETLFRGVLFGMLRRAAGWWLALGTSSLIFAWVHFFARPVVAAPAGPWSGLMVLGQMMRGFVQWHALVPGFFNLLLAGMVLAAGYERFGALYFSIGLHAGWIFWLKFYGAIAESRPGADWWFWGTPKLIDGWAAAPLLAAAFCWAWLGRGKVKGGLGEQKGDDFEEKPVEKLA